MKLNATVKIAIGPLLSTLLFLGCVGQQSGGNGGGQQASAGGKLYISNLADSTLLIYGNAATANGNQAPTRTVQDLNAQSFILTPSAVFVDTANNLLYVANTGLNQILVYQNANAVDGNAVPDRVISGTATLLNAPRGLAVDTTNDILYVSNTGSNTILVFDNASLLNGPVVPAQTITADQPWGLFVDSGNDRLYATSAGQNAVLVFDAASSNATLARTITFSNTGTTLPLPRLSNPSGVFVDTANDRLFVACGNDSILVFDNAGAIIGETTPDRAVSGGQTGLSNPTGIYVDAGALYVANSNNAILGFNNAATVNGDVAPNRTISGTATTLSSPGGIVVASNVFYAANPGDNSILVFNNAGTATGNIAPDRAVSDATGPLAFPSGIVMDTGQNLLYAAKLVSSISVFENASALANNPPVTRTISPASGTACSDSATTREDLCSPRGISVDTVNDQLFVANTGASSVLVFNQASTATGNISPNQTLLPASGTVCNDSATTKMDLCFPLGVTVNTSNNRLFVANTGASSVLVFNQASTATGNISPNQTLLPASGTACNDSATTKMDLCSPSGVFVDSVNDRLYVANTSAGSILVFNGASGLTGAISPNRTVLPVSGTSCNDSATTQMDLCSPIGIFVDTVNDRLYVANTSANSILVFNNASTIAGNAIPDRVIAQGTDPNDNTTLNTPFGVFVDTAR